MRELALHILDIAQNSLAAGASLLTITINENLAADLLTIEISDNGRGIPTAQLPQLTNPFFTSRVTREVGLGLPLLAQAAQRAEGHLEIDSKVGSGTKVTATFRHSHLDRAPLGDLIGTLLSIITLNPKVDLIYQHHFRNRTFLFDTREIKHELGAVAINHPTVIHWLQGFLRAELDDLYGGE